MIAVKANNKLMSSVNNSRRISFSEPIITRNYHAKQVLSAGNLFSFWVEYGGFNRTMLYLLPMGFTLIFYLSISIISLHHIAKSRSWTVTPDGEVPGTFLPSFCNSPLAFSWVTCCFFFVKAPETTRRGFADSRVHRNLERRQTAGNLGDAWPLILVVLCRVWQRELESLPNTGLLALS